MGGAEHADHKPRREVRALEGVGRFAQQENNRMCAQEEIAIAFLWVLLGAAEEMWGGQGQQHAPLVRVPLLTEDQ